MFVCKTLNKRARSALFTAFAVTCALGVTSVATAAPQNGTGFGLADSVYGQPLPEPFVSRLGPKVYRVQIPYDITTCGTVAGVNLASQLEARLTQVRALGVRKVLGTFAMNCNDLLTSPTPPNSVPTDSDYTNGVTAAIARFNGLVDEWSPANEPNHTNGWFGNSIDSGGPARLASYYNILRGLIPSGDELVSPEFTSTASPTTGALKLYPGTSVSLQKTFITRYLAAVSQIPGAGNGWGSHAAFHPYDSVRSQDATAITEFEGLVPQGTDVWLTEIGGLVPSPTYPSKNNASIDQQVVWLADKVRDDGRIARAYYYNPYGVSGAWDSALTFVSSALPRPAWSTWCSRSRYLGPNSGTLPCPTSPSTPAPGFTLSPGEYRVARTGANAGWVLTDQVAQKFKAADVGIASVSLRLGSVTGRVTVSIYSGPEQSAAQLLGSTTVNVASSGDTTATFDSPIAVTGQGTYYMQAISADPNTKLTFTNSIWDDDYNSGGAQYGWDGNFFGGPDLNARIRTVSDVVLPTVPSNPTASAVAGGKEIVASWGPSTDDQPGTVSYDAYVNGVASGSTTATSIRLTGLTCSTNYAIRIAARDLAGNRAYSPVISVATGPCVPVVTITAPNTNQSLSASAVGVSFTVTVNAADSVTCALDGGIAAPCTSPASFASLADGAHSVVVTASNSSGAHSATASFVVDTVPPVLTFSSPFAGTVSSQAVRVIAAANEPVSQKACAVDGSTTFAACDFSDWTTTFDTGGAHSVTIKAVDAAGNSGTATRAFTIDAPVIAFTTPAAGSMQPSEVVKVSATVDRPVVKYECTTDNLGLEHYTLCDISNWNAVFQNVSGTASGAHAVKIRVTDASGNIGIAKRAFTVDLATVSVSGGTWPNVNMMGGTTVQISATPSPTATAAGGGTGYTFWCSGPDGDKDCTNGYTFSGSGFSLGPNSFVVRATDNKGFVTTYNTSYEGTFGF